MVKRKSLPKKGEQAGYAARTSERVTDSTESNSDEYQSEESSDNTESRNQTEITTKKKIERSGIAKSNIAKPKHKSVVLKEIRNLQKTTNLLIPRAPFLRLIRELIMQRTGQTGFRITEMAVEALREASENVLVSIFEDSYLLALHAKRVTLFPRDMALLLRLRNDFNLISSN